MSEVNRPRSFEILRERFDEKAKVAGNAAETLSKLNVVMRQMKEWRSDRARLKSKIWRLKLALRSMGKEHDENPQTDPLIEHQRQEIRELELANNVLENEVVELKSSLAEAEEDFARAAAWKLRSVMTGAKERFALEKKRMNSEILYLRKRLREVEEEHTDSALSRLRRKLREFAEGDRTMEMIVADVASKVAETVANLSEELVNVSEDLYRSESINEERGFEIDRLRAMLRSKSGNAAEYRKRASELKNLTMRLKEETERLRSIFDDPDGSLECYEVSRNVEILMNELQLKLKHDREALLTGGNPACLGYVKKIIDLRVGLNRLRDEVEKSSCRMQKLLYASNKDRAFDLETALRQLDAEIDRLRVEPVTNHRGVVDGATFLRKVEKLERTLEKSRVLLAELKVDEIEVKHPASAADKLEDLVNDLCGEIKEIESYVSPDDTSMFEVVKQLEESIVRLKVDASRKDESMFAMERQLSTARNMIEQKNCEMKNAQEKVVKLIEKGKQQESRIADILRERDEFKLRLIDLEDSRRKLQHLQKEKEAMLSEMDRLRNTVTEKNEHILKLITERDSNEKALKAELTALSAKLSAALDENSKLKKEEAKRVRSTKSVHFEDTDPKNELERLKAELHEAKSHLENQNETMADLTARLNKMTDDRSRLEANIFDLISCKEVLRCQLDAERIAGQEKDQALKKLSTENECLRTNLDESKVESDSLRASVGELNNKCSALESQTDSFKTARDALERVIRYLQANSDDLKLTLTEARTQLKLAQDEVAELRAQKSFLTDQSAQVSICEENLSENLEESLRMQLAGNNGSLSPDNKPVKVVKDQPNEASVAEDECLGVEPNKSVRANESTTSKRPTCRPDVTYEEWVGAGRSEASEEYSGCEDREVDDRIKDDQLKPKSDVQPASNDGESVKTKYGQEYGTKCELVGQSVEQEPLKGEPANLRDEDVDTGVLSPTETYESSDARCESLDFNDKMDDSLASRDDKVDAGSIVGRQGSLISSEASTNECEVPKDLDSEEGSEMRGSAKRLSAENSMLKERINDLRESVDVCSEKYRKTQADLRSATEEMRALKFELNRLRREKSSLMMQLNLDRGGLERLRDEKIALKNELVNVREANSMLRAQLNDLRIVRDRLMRLNTNMKDRVMNVFNEVNVYTLPAERLTGFEDKLKNVFQEYVSAGDCDFNDHSRMNIAEADVRHIEGQRAHVAN